MANVGSAYVTLMPSMKGFAGALSNEFGASGGKAGKSFGDGLSSGIEGGAARSEGILSKLGGAVATVGKVAAVGFTALTGAVAAIGGAALSAYADYEQLVGGVDTLFGDASGKLQGYAAEAYKTAGMSANQYMTQATSFAASLVQSTGGDTAQAAEYANLAMTSMSDNVNKMGSSMQSVQDAYQGFAKQNYTMLDNLKLGYGGTKTEMERLISDANKLPGVLKQGSDLSIESYSDVVEAIARVQNKMGITGTTAKEAATTITGSIGMAKASWENFLTSLGRDDVDFTQVTTELLDSIGAVATNVAPRVATIGKGIIQAMPAALSGLGTVLAPVFSEAVATAWGIAANALKGIGIELPPVESSQILESINGAMDMAKLAMTDPAAFIERGRELVSSAASGIRAAIPGLVSAALDGVSGLASGFKTGFPQLVAAGGELLLGAVQGVMDSLPDLIEKGPQIVSDFANGISAAAETLLGVGVKILGAIGQGLLDSIPTFVANIPEIIQAAWDAFMAFQWLSIGTTLVKNIAGGIAKLGSQIPTKLKGFFDTAVSNGAKFVSDLAAKGLQAGANFLLNIAANISQMPGRFAGWLSETILGAAGFVGDLGAKATAAGSGYLSRIGAYISQLPGRIAGWFSSVVGSAGSLVGSLASRASSAGSGFLSRIGSYISQLPGRVAGWFSSVIGSAGSLVGSLASRASSAGSGFLNGIRGGFNSAVSFVSSIPGRILGAIGNMGSLLVNSGRSLINGFVSGVRNAIGGAVSAVSGMVGKIRNLFPFSPAKDGPFSGHGYTTWSGRALMSDFADSIAAQSGKVTSATASVLAAAQRGLSAQLVTPRPAASPAAVPHPQQRAVTMNFYGKTESPDEIARMMRLNERYGFAGSY